jgi:hypothetical protein
MTSITFTNNNSSYVVIVKTFPLSIARAQAKSLFPIFSRRLCRPATHGDLQYHTHPVDHTRPHEQAVYRNRMLKPLVCMNIVVREGYDLTPHICMCTAILTPEPTEGRVSLHTDFSMPLYKTDVSCHNRRRKIERNEKKNKQGRRVWHLYPSRDRIILKYECIRAPPG